MHHSRLASPRSGSCKSFKFHCGVDSRVGSVPWYRKKTSTRLAKAAKFGQCRMCSKPLQPETQTSVILQVRHWWFCRNQTRLVFGFPAAGITRMELLKQSSTHLRLVKHWIQRMDMAWKISWNSGHHWQNAPCCACVHCLTRNRVSKRMKELCSKFRKDFWFLRCQRYYPALCAPPECPSAVLEGYVLPNLRVCSELPKGPAILQKLFQPQVKNVFFTAQFCAYLYVHNIVHLMIVGCYYICSYFPALRALTQRRCFDRTLRLSSGIENNDKRYSVLATWFFPLVQRSVFFHRFVFQIFCNVCCKSPSFTRFSAVELRSTLHNGCRWLSQHQSLHDALWLHAFVAGILGGSLPRNCGCPQHPQQTPTFVPENLRDMLSSLIDSAPWSENWKQWGWNSCINLPMPSKIGNTSVVAMAFYPQFAAAASANPQLALSKAAALFTSVGPWNQKICFAEKLKCTWWIAVSGWSSGIFICFHQMQSVPWSFTNVCMGS